MKKTLRYRRLLQRNHSRSNYKAHRYRQLLWHYDANDDLADPREAIVEDATHWSIEATHIDTIFQDIEKYRKQELRRGNYREHLFLSLKAQ